MKERLDARGKTLRAFGAYLDLQKTTDWIRKQIRGQLHTFEITIAGFRVLELLYREGPTHMNETARRLEYERQNLFLVVQALEERGFVRRERETLPLVNNKRNQELKAMGDTEHRGRAVTRLRLTAAGRKYIANLFPRHAKVVKALMRALDGREQATLSRLCRKLRKGNFWKYLTELKCMRAGEEFDIDVEDLKREIQEIRGG